MAKKKSSSFRGKTKKNAENRKKGTGYSYLKLPKGVDVFSPEPDTKVDMDIMPYLVTDKHHPDRDEPNEIAVEGTYWYKRPFKVHRGIGANNDTVICPASFGKKCPICEYREKLRKQDYESNEDEIKTLRPSDRNLYAIILKKIDKKRQDDKIHVLDISDYLFQEKFEDQLADKEEFESFPDHKEGYTLSVKFAENSFGQNKFADPSRFDFLVRSEQYDDDILGDIPKLDECFIILSYEELKAKFFEAIEEEDDDDDKPARKKKSDKPAKKRKVEEPEDEEDDEDEEDEEDDEDEEEDSDDEEDEEEDSDDEEDEEEEEPAPVKRKREKKEEPKKESKKEGKCPSGYKFGIDTDKHDECEDCKMWNSCYEAKKNNKRR